MKSKGRSKVRLNVERLEGRQLLSGGITSAAGIVTIEGTSGADVAHVVQHGNKIVIDLSTPGEATVVRTFKRSQVRRVVFQGVDGTDTFINRSTVKATAIGGNGSDFFQAGKSGDVLIGGSGSDTLIGGSGHDRLVGGPSADVIIAGKGRAVITDGGGNDTIHLKKDDRVTDRSPGDVIIDEGHNVSGT
jgi:Ca2+-binding RTX toxin-like protein